MPGISTRIKRERLLRGIGPEDMAKHLHISKRAYQNIENGTTKMDIERLKAIADIFEMSIMEFMNSDENTFIYEITNNSQNGLFKEITINNEAKVERELLNQIITEKEEQIKILKEELSASKSDLITLRNQLSNLVEKLAGKL